MARHLSSEGWLIRLIQAGDSLGEDDGVVIYHRKMGAYVLTSSFSSGTTPMIVETHLYFLTEIETSSSLRLLVISFLVIGW